MKYLKSEELKFTNKNDDGTCTYTGDITINNGGNFVYTFRDNIMYMCTVKYKIKII